MNRLVGTTLLCALAGLAACGSDGNGTAGMGGAGMGGAGTGGAGMGGAGTGGAGMGGAGMGGAGMGGAGTGAAGMGGAGTGGAGTGGAGMGGAGMGGAGMGGAGMGGAGGSGACIGSLAVTIDGMARTGCVTQIATGGLNHIFSTLDDGHQLIVNVGGMVPAMDVCGGFGYRAPGSDVNDWISVAGMGCDVDVTEYGMRGGGHVIGTFSGTVSPAPNRPVMGDHVLSNGMFDVTLP